MSRSGLDALWMPFTPNRDFKAAPRMVRAASGMNFTDVDGRTILDATAGLWCCNAGHGRPEIADAVARRLRTLDYGSPFNFAHEIGFAFAERLVKFAPAGLEHVFLANSGSEAVESALKLAMQYWWARGKPEKRRFIGRRQGYHGVNLGGVAVGGIPANSRVFGQWLMVDHLRAPLDIERNAFSRGLPDQGVEWAEELVELIARHGAGTIAAVIVEPVAGAGGVLLPPKGYLARLREICDQNDILLIFDEVITGWGRLGAPFASIEFGVTPDLMTSAKGITNGAIPLSAVFVSSDIHRVCMERSDTAVEFYHGYTYSGHPVACAAGMATLDIYEDEGLLTRARADGEVARYWQDGLHSLGDMEQVRDVRNYGLIGAIELHPGKRDAGTLGPRALALAWSKGVMVRGIGDAICMSPPLIIERTHIDRIVEVLRDVITEIV